MKNLVLFPTWGLYFNNKEAIQERFPRETHQYIFMDKGAYVLEGLRFNDVHVHWHCHEEPHYDVFVAMILQARAFSADPGQAYLFS